MKTSLAHWRTAAVAATLLLAATACGTDDTSTSAPQRAGSVLLDGSSTVAPLMELAGDDFHNANSGVDITVHISGTGGGFQTFCAGKTDIADASRPINDAEAAACKTAGIEYYRIIVANDALSVVVNLDNDWAECLTVAQLNTMWAPASEGTVTNWNQIDPSFPDKKLDLYGADTESGTFDYFTEAINGEVDASRSDYGPSGDDNITVARVAGSEGALGYFGFSYLESNLQYVKPVAIDDGNGCVEPSAQAVADGTYTPLSRPLYIYVKTEAARREEVRAFVRYFIDHQDDLTYDALFIPLNDQQKDEQAAAVAALAT